jgi:hypothetical protein
VASLALDGKRNPMLPSASVEATASNAAWLIAMRIMMDQARLIGERARPLLIDNTLALASPVT